MPTYSLTDYATRALKAAGLISSEEIPSAADLSDAMEVISADTATLQARGVNIWNGGDTAVPEEWFAAGARYHAVNLKEEYGLIGMLEAEQSKQILERTLRAISMVGATSAPQKSEHL